MACIYVVWIYQNFESKDHPRETHTAVVHDWSVDIHNISDYGHEYVKCWRWEHQVHNDDKKLSGPQFNLQNHSLIQKARKVIHQVQASAMDKGRQEYTIDVSLEDD